MKFCSYQITPENFYFDRYSVFFNEEDQGLTQFGRMCNELGINMIFANTPQAKGKVERWNFTIQNRLLIDIKRFNIQTVDELNKWFNSYYIKYLNKKFAYEPKEKESEFVKIDRRKTDLSLIFCRKGERKIVNGNCISYYGYYYQIINKDGSNYPMLRDALEKLSLNDASLSFEPETSSALGFGFRCGFLGLLHLEIIQERLEREYNLELVTTAPGVVYKIYMSDKSCIDLSNPCDLPDVTKISKMEEPIIKAQIVLPPDYIGAVMKLCQERRGIYIDMQYLDDTRVRLIYNLPLNEIIYDFFDVLKSRSRGYASLDYELIGYKESDLVRLDILINHELIDSLSFIVHRSTAYERGKKMVEKLKTQIPRQLFEIPIQASIGNKIIARQTISAMRKDVLAKCYGGDISRKRKLLEKQKEGKKRMRQVGSVEIPQSAFMSVLKLNDE